MKRLLTVLVAGLGGAAAYLATQDFPYSTQAWAGCDEQARPGVQWEDCRKRNLIMQGTDFSGANMARSDLSSSDLRQIKLGKADMQKANLTRASLMGAQAVEGVELVVLEGCACATGELVARSVVGRRGDAVGVGVDAK